MSKYRIQVASDTDYEELIAEIYVDERFVALVNQEHGKTDLRVDFPGPEQNQAALLRSVPLGTLLDALAAAKAQLLEE